MPSALILPGGDPVVIVGPTGKRPKALSLVTWKHILRAIKIAKSEGWSIHFSCPDCRRPIRMTVPNKAAPQFECDCTNWTGR